MAALAEARARLQDLRSMEHRDLALYALAVEEELQRWRARQLVVSARKLALSFALGVLLMFALSTAHAADFSVNPMSLTLPQGSRSGEIKIKNHADTALRLVVRALAWSQVDGKDIYADTRALLFFPRALEIAPGDTRTIRVGVRAPTRQAFVLNLSEVSLAADTPSGAGQGAHIRLLLNVQVPVIFAGQ